MRQVSNAPYGANSQEEVEVAEVAEEEEEEAAGVAEEEEEEDHQAPLTSMRLNNPLNLPKM